MSDYRDDELLQGAREFSFARLESTMVVDDWKKRSDARMVITHVVMIARCLGLNEEARSVEQGACLGVLNDVRLRLVDLVTADAPNYYRCLGLLSGVLVLRLQVSEEKYVQLQRAVLRFADMWQRTHFFQLNEVIAADVLYSGEVHEVIAWLEVVVVKQL